MGVILIYSQNTLERPVSRNTLNKQGILIYPQNTLRVQNSYLGRQGVWSSGASMEGNL